MLNSNTWNADQLRKLSEHKEKVQLRRSRVTELNAEGRSQREIATILHVSHGIINSDLAVLRRQARINIRTYVDQQLPFEHQSCMAAVAKLLRKAWDIINDEHSSEKAVANAMHTVLDCLRFKRALLMDKTDLRVIEEQIRNEALEFNPWSQSPELDKLTVKEFSNF
jgi:DNA-binding CsgD family transcriptional regulator